MLTQIWIPQFYYANKLPGNVLTGPFAGMLYSNKIIGGILLPQLIGTYEDKLSVVWNEVKGNNYTLFINAGASEGYYSIGVKKYLLPQVPSVAYEMSVRGQKAIARLASKNGVEVVVKGICTIQNLTTEVAGRYSLLLMDVEGAEKELLNLLLIDFSLTDILVEVHPAADANLETEIISRFQNTHLIRVIQKHSKKLPAEIEYPV